MKRYLVGMMAGCAIHAASAGELDRLQTLNQSQFRLISEDLGAVVSSKASLPSAPLGVTGFDLGVSLTATSLRHHDLVQQASSSSVPTLFPLAQLRAWKGLPADIDVGFSYIYLPGSDIRAWGLEARYALMAGSLVLPSVSLRGSYTRLSGIKQLDLNTKGVDISVSKKILLVTPYAGAGYVFVNSEPNASTGLRSESFGYPKLFAGVRGSLGVAAFVFEVDRTGNVFSYGLRFGVGF